MAARLPKNQPKYARSSQYARELGSHLHLVGSIIFRLSMNLATLQKEPSAFRGALLINGDEGTERYGPNLDSWQREDFAAIDHALKRVVGQDGTAIVRAYLERPRGHSKTTDI